MNALAFSHSAQSGATGVLSHQEKVGHRVVASERSLSPDPGRRSVRLGLRVIPPPPPVVTLRCVRISEQAWACLCPYLYASFFFLLTISLTISTLHHQQRFQSTHICHLQNQQKTRQSLYPSQVLTAFPTTTQDHTYMSIENLKTFGASYSPTLAYLTSQARKHISPAMFMTTCPLEKLTRA